MGSEILPVDHDKLKLFEKEWKTHLKDLKDLPCSNEEEKTHWSMWLGFVQAALADLEDERKQTTQPINEDLRRVNGYYKKAGEIAENTKALIKSKLNAYAEACLKAEKELLLKAEEYAKAGDTEASQAALQALPNVQKAKGASTDFVWAWRLLDWSKLDESYKTVNDVALDQVCKVHKGKDACPNIPGIEFYQKARTSAR